MHHISERVIFHGEEGQHLQEIHVALWAETQRMSVSMTHLNAESSNSRIKTITKLWFVRYTAHICSIEIYPIIEGGGSDFRKTDRHGQMDPWNDACLVLLLAL